MGDKNRGLYGKFNIRRTDGKDAPGQKHEKCDYFVLDLTHDPFARQALAMYAHACRQEYPLLAADLQAKLARWQDANGKLEVPGFEQVEPGRFEPNPPPPSTYNPD